MAATDYDWIVIGSGFGGSVAALRLSEKGYRVLVLEKGRRFAPEDFPRHNWDLRNWMWNPALGLRGHFQMTFFEHVSVLHGVGVGGGSLCYANTLPTPKDAFFEADSWAALADWRSELAPHYDTAVRMLGATTNPRETPADRVLRDIARDLGREEHWGPTRVGVFFGEPDVTAPDPYFDGKGPERVGCNHCGACMTGCRVGAKNTLDRNYLYLAERLGAQVLAQTEVTAVRPNGGPRYLVETRPSMGRGRGQEFCADHVVFAGGVLGTVPLLLRMREDPHGLPGLSARIGDAVRTNNEAIIGVVCPDTTENFADGVAITSILNTDEHSHLEPVHYGKRSDFFRTLCLPHAPAPTLRGRLLGALRCYLRDPMTWAKIHLKPDLSGKGTSLLFMRTLESTLSLRLEGRRRRLVTKLDDPMRAPSAFMDEANDLARRWQEKTGGVQQTLLTELLRATPSTAHILGGCPIGADAEDGAIDTDHRLFGYDGLFVVDGAAISANPGVNPALTITAMAERTMSLVPAASA